MVLITPAVVLLKPGPGPGGPVDEPSVRLPAAVIVMLPPAPEPSAVEVMVPPLIVILPVVLIVMSPLEPRPLLAAHCVRGSKKSRAG